MRTGKISENTLKRSVLKNIENAGDRLIHGADVRDNCAVFSYANAVDEYGVITEERVILPSALDSLTYSIIRGANNLYAAAAKPEAVNVSMLLPSEFEEPDLALLIKKAGEICRLFSMSLGLSEVKTDPRISVPAISVSVMGTRTQKDLPKVSPDWDVVLSGPIALAGTTILAKEKREALQERYPKRYIAQADKFAGEVSVYPEAATARESFVCRMYAVSEGGIFAALWEAAEMAGVGLDIDLKRIPIRQETVEICDYLGINPYELMSDGTLMIFTPNGDAMCEKMQDMGIPAQNIGKTTKEKGKVLRNVDEVRYVDKPASDSIYSLFTQN